MGSFNPCTQDFRRPDEPDLFSSEPGPLARCNTSIGSRTRAVRTSPTTLRAPRRSGPQTGRSALLGGAYNARAGPARDARTFCDSLIACGFRREAFYPAYASRSDPEGHGAARGRPVVVRVVRSSLEAGRAERTRKLCAGRIGESGRRDRVVIVDPERGRSASRARSARSGSPSRSRPATGPGGRRPREPSELNSPGGGASLPAHRRSWLVRAARSS